MNKNDLLKALEHPVWVRHKIGAIYSIVRDEGDWKIAYYPIFTNNKTKEVYKEPRALIEKPLEKGIDFREVPLRYLKQK